MMKVQILLSTYNGQKYLAQQLDSILGQTYSNWCLLIRDDGSSDETATIAEDYVKRYPDRIRFISEENRGACQSFLALAQQADEQCDYYAFCDQDDVWKEDKLERAVRALEKEQAENLPLLYCSALEVVDERLDVLFCKDLSVYAERLGFGNALVENVCTGCTMVLNICSLAALRELPGSVAEHILMHDWWVYLYVSCFGRVIYDSYAGISYRQHQNNVVGETPGGFKKLCHKIQTFRGNRGKLRGQMAAFGEMYGNRMPQEKRELLMECLNLHGHPRKRLALARSGRIYRLNRRNQLVCKLLIILDFL